MPRAVDGHGYFVTGDGLDIWVTLGICFGGDGPPRVEIASISDPEQVVPVPAIERAAKRFLYELTVELRRHAPTPVRPVRADPKPKDRASPGKRRVAR